ncbi:hypothetical protein [Fluviibacterium sp. S390]|uniref:hypothetical protein n=1 Tax=Fluviibacterium sp. S390 TaxID=3415139 RepID=UPI003C79D72B
MADDYQTFNLIWQAREIAVAFRANWLNSGHWHIELRCCDRLPVTETGYPSIFVPATGFDDRTEIEAYIRTLLDEAANTPEWRRYLEDSRQLDLF